ncbi:hypothetical protein [Thomasclavelia spiroformis]|uniref:hypothetical protein n=1 Tax=Thomasclavelia spiroformis TaxID=29348 RepID=UPI00399F39C8
MIVSMIRQFGLRLRADPEEIPFQYSSNIQMQFIKDENYNDYTVVGYYIPPGENEAKLLNINDDGTFTLGPDCFKNRGTLSFSFNLVNSIEEVHLGSIDFDVRHAFGDSSAILPEPEEVWISVVTKVAEDAIKEDVELVKQKAKEASQSALTASEKANEALEYANNAKDASNSAITAKDDAIAASNSASQFSDTAEKSAIEAKNSADDALKNANASNKAIETVNQIKTQIEDKANEFDTNYQEKQNAFNQSVTSANDAFDNKVNQANSDLDAKVQEANTIIDEKVKTATEQAQKATDEANRAEQATDGKLDKNLGVENSDKVLITDAEGNIITQNKEDFEGGGTTNYNDLENKPQINGVELSGNQSGNNVGLVDAQQGIENSGKVLGIDQDGLVVPVENAGASDNIIYKDVAKSLNPNITDSFLRALWNLKMYGQSTQENTTGSQLWVNPKPKTLNGVTLTIENGWAILNGTCTANGNISIGQRKLEAGEYTLNAEVEGSYPVKGTVVSQVYSANGGILTITTGSISPITRELNSADNYEFRIFIKKDFVYNNYKVRTMLNKGSEALPWEPYTGGQPSPSPQYPQEITAISEFSGQVNNGSEHSQPFTYTTTNPMYSTQDGSIADYVDVEKGVEVYNMSGKVVFDGSVDEAWYIYPSGNGFYIKLSNMLSGLRLKGWCDRFNIIQSGYDTGVIFGLGNNQLYVTSVNEYATTVEEWKIWLSQNPITVVYPLATPTEIPINPEQLQMLRALYTYTGVTNFLCNVPVSFTYKRSLQIVINNLENAIGQTNANILLNGGNN